MKRKLMTLAILAFAFGPTVLALERPVSGAAMGVSIPVELPAAGRVSLQIRDAKGAVVGNVISTNVLAKGRRTVDWDLTGPDDNVYAGVGTYSYKALFVPDHTLAYRGCFYPTPLKKGATPWANGTGTGGWGADHYPPKSIVRVGDYLFITALCEAGDGVIKVDRDMNKVWGTRGWVFNTPYASAADGDTYYGFKNGVKTVDARTNKRGGVNTKASGGSFAVIDKIAYFTTGDELTVWDFHDGKDVVRDRPIDTIPVPQPGQVRRTPRKKLICFSDRDVVFVDPKTKAVTPFAKDVVEEKGGLAIREDGLVAVGDMKRHQVFLFDAKGKPAGTLGKGGPRPVGPWDDDTLQCPFGLEFGPDGRLWVCEHTGNPKRVSVWNCRTLRCEKAVVGPTNYGGGGCVDPDDADRAFYGGLELRRGADGEYRPAGLFFVGNTPPCGPWGGTPTYAFRAKGRLWFTDQQNAMGNGGNVLYVYEKDHARAVAAFGNGDLLSYKLPQYKGRKIAFSWTDLNDDGALTEDECTFTDAVGAISTGWVNRMNEKFEIAFDCEKSRVVKFSPTGFTKAGWPIYDAQKLAPVAAPYVRAHHQGQSASSHLVDRAGNVLTLSKPLLSISPDGTVNFRYRNRWPSLHDSHETSENGRHLGELIGTTRFWGAAWLNDDVGEIFCFNSNLGCAYLMTADGLFVAQLMQDQRCGYWWGQDAIPDSDTLKLTSMQDEHFLGEFQRTKFGGRDALAMVCGKTFSAVIEIGGLDGAKRLKDGTFKVGEKEVAAARRTLADKRFAGFKPKAYTVRDRAKTDVSDGFVTANVWNGAENGKGPDGDQFRLVHDGRSLFFEYSANDPDATFANAGTDVTTLFETGDAVDLMIETDPKADANRRTAAKGDLRFLFAEMDGTCVCVRYDYRGKKGKRVTFESPVGRLEAADVSVCKDVHAWVERKGTRFTLRAILPFATLGNVFAKGRGNGDSGLGTVRGDVGRIRSDSSGRIAVDRVYWSNPATMLMSDRPSQAGVEPRFWGELTFKGKLAGGIDLEEEDLSSDDMLDL